MSYQRAIYKNWGKIDKEDIYATYKFLISKDYVNSDRIAIYGGSYGGFVSLTALTRIPVKWAAGIVISAPTDLITYINRAPIMWREILYELIGHPEEDWDRLMTYSPANYLENISCPLLVIHGAKDPRVPIKESHQLINKLKSLKKEVNYEIFDDEGHGFSKRKNELKMSKIVTDFLVENLISKN